MNCVQNMTFRVELTERATRDLQHIFNRIQADSSKQAQAWLNRLERAILTLEQHPARHSTIPEDAKLRHLLHGRKPHVYRVIYAIDESSNTVTVLHIRHGAQSDYE